MEVRRRLIPDYFEKDFGFMATKKKTIARYYPINSFSKLSLKEQTDGRWVVYLLKKGEKSKIVRRFAHDKGDDADQYCRNMAETFGQMTPKVTLVERQPEKMGELDQYRHDKIVFIKGQLEGQGQLNKEVFLDMFDILLQQHKAIAWLSRMVSTLSAQVATLERQVQAGGS